MAIDIQFSDPEKSNLYKTYQSAFIIRYKKIKYLTIFSIGTKSETKLIFFYPVSSMYKPVYKVIRIILIITLIAVIFVIIISFFVSRIVTNPIHELSEASVRITNGDYSTQVSIVSKNEIGNLAESFNVMVNKVRKYTKNLEVLIIERTEALSNANKKLIDMNIELTEKNEFKSKFMANMSHEIRTPLNAIMGNNQLILYGNYDYYYDILNINNEILEFIERNKSDIPQNLKNELNPFCMELKTLVFDEKKRLKEYFYLKIRNILNKYTDNFGGNKVFIMQLQSIITDFEELILNGEKRLMKNLQTSNRSGKYLIDLINSILDIAKIEANIITLSIKEVIISDFVNDVYNSAISYQKSKNKENELVIKKEIMNNVPKTANFDQNRIKQVLLNLISNSIKFTEKGEVAILVDTDDEYIEFIIKDTGMGIKKNEIDKLFKEFGRTSSTMDIEGTGLGLVLSKKLVELHGGKIELKSEYGKGSEFTVCLLIDILD